MQTSAIQTSRTRWEEHVSTWSTSGLTQSAYCRLHDLKAKTFSAWVGRVSQTDALHPTPLTLVPVVVQSRNTRTRPDAPHITLQHHSGWQLQLSGDVQANWLGNVLGQIT